MSANKGFRSRRSSAYRPTLEVLEDRLVPSGFALGLEGDAASNGTTALDASGNFYVSGTFQGSLDFDSGPGEHILSSAGEDDAFVAKYAPDGAFQWARRIGSPGADSSVGNGYAWSSVKVAPDGMICFSTGFTGTADITGINNDGTTYTSSGSVTAVGTLDTLVGTMDSDGNVLWTRAIGGEGATLLPRPLAVAPDGSILLAGSFTGTADFDRTASYGDNRDVLVSAGYEDIFVAKLTSTGSFAWATRAGGVRNESALIAVDTVGNAYVSGAFLSSSISFGSQTLTRRSAIGADSFTSKIDVTTGQFVWVQQIGGADAYVPYGGSAAYHDPAETDPEQGNSVYVSGNLYQGDGPVTFGNSNITLTRTTGMDAFVAKLDGNGNFLWAKQVQGWTDVDPDVLTTDAAGNLYATFRLTGSGTTDLDPGSEQALVAMRPGSTQDAHLVKLDPDGTFLWARQEGRNVRHAIGADGAIYAVGTYDAATTEFDVGSSSVTLATPPGDTKAFYLLRIDQNALGAVFGKVLYANGYPAEGAAVTLQQNGNVVASTTTGSFGEYNLRYLPTGDYTVQALGGSRAFTLTEAGQFLSSQNIVLPLPVESTKFYVVDDASSDRTYQYGATGSTNANTALAAGNTAPRDVTSNQQGTRVWVADANNTVYVYNANGALLGSWAASGLPKNSEVQGIATNGTDIWLLTASSKQGDRVYRFAGAASRLSGSQKAASSFALSSGNTNPTGIVTDGTSFWVVDNSTTDRVFKYTLTGSLLGSWSIDPANGSPTGITINPNDVSHIWIVDNSALKVFQYSSSTSRTSGTQLADRTFTLAPGNTNPQGIADPPCPDLFFAAASASESASGALARATLTGSAARTPAWWGESANPSWSWLVDSNEQEQAAFGMPTHQLERSHVDLFLSLAQERGGPTGDARDDEGAHQPPRRHDRLISGSRHVVKVEWTPPLFEVDATSDLPDRDQ